MSACARLRRSITSVLQQLVYTEGVHEFGNGLLAVRPAKDEEYDAYPDEVPNTERQIFGPCEAVRAFRVARITCKARYSRNAYRRPNNKPFDLFATNGSSTYRPCTSMTIPLPVILPVASSTHRKAAFDQVLCMVVVRKWWKLVEWEVHHPRGLPDDLIQERVCY